MINSLCANLARNKQHAADAVLVVAPHLLIRVVLALSSRLPVLPVKHDNAVGVPRFPLNLQKGLSAWSVDVPQRLLIVFAVAWIVEEEQLIFDEVLNLVHAELGHFLDEIELALNL